MKLISSALTWKHVKVKLEGTHSESAYIRQVNLQHNNDKWMIPLLRTVLTLVLTNEWSLCWPMPWCHHCTVCCCKSILRDVLHFCTFLQNPHFDLEPDYIIRKPIERFQQYLVCSEIVSTFHTSWIHFSVNNTSFHTFKPMGLSAHRLTHKSENSISLADIISKMSYKQERLSYTTTTTTPGLCPDYPEEPQPERYKKPSGCRGVADRTSPST